MEFPEKSIKQAREIADKYRQRSKSKKNIAASLYYGDFLEIGYGFSESLKTGNCGRYLHEIIKETDCFTMAGALYLIAREANLKPKIHWASSMKDVKEGEDPNTQMTADHAFISVSVGKNTEYIIDPHTGIFGKAKFIPSRNSIQIYSSAKRELYHRTYGSLRKLSQTEYISKLEENRGSEGGKIALASTQKIRGADKLAVFLTYLPDTKELRSSMAFPLAKPLSEPYEKIAVFNLITPVSKNGKYDFSKGKLSFFDAYSYNWQDYNRPQLPIYLKTQSAIDFWKIIDTLFIEQGRKSPARHAKPLKLINLLQEEGLNADFSINPGSSIDSLIKNYSFEELIEQTKASQQESVADFFREIKSDDITYRCFLRKALYLKESEKSKSPSNKEGFIFSKEKHVGLLENLIEEYDSENLKRIKVLKERFRVMAKLTKGTTYNAERKVSVQFEKSGANQNYIIELASLRQSSFPLEFNYIVDQNMFNDKFDIANISLTELEKGLDANDIEKAIQSKIFERLIGAYAIKNTLFLASFKKGIEKLLGNN